MVSTEIDSAALHHGPICNFYIYQAASYYLPYYFINQVSPTGVFKYELRGSNITTHSVFKSAQTLFYGARHVKF